MTGFFHRLAALRARAALVLFALLAHAAVAAAQEHPAQALVRETAGKVIEELTSDPSLKQDRPRLHAMIDELVLPHFDFTRMSRRVLAKNWRKASDAEKTQFTAAFKALLVRTYSSALAEYSDQTIEFLQPRERPQRKEVAVRSQVRRSGAPPIEIQYTMYEKDGRWLVYDVLVDGISLVINYRSTFASEIRNNGMAGLIKRLSERNREG